ncbi:MAG: phosphatase PAP2 family protein [Gemmatimonadaceae bacterium]
MTKGTEKPSRSEFARLILIPASVLLLVLMTAWIARPVVNGVLGDSAVMRLDLTLLHWFRSQATGALDATFVFIALLGAPVTLGVVSVVGAVLIYRRRQWGLFIVWIEATSGSSALSVGIKHMYLRPRPQDAGKFLHDMSFSFPSTHALGSMVVLGMVTLAIAVLQKGRNGITKTAKVVIPILIVLIGLSRLYLGVHYLSDVAAGFGVGGIWLFVCIVTFQKRQRTLL